MEELAQQPGEVYRVEIPIRVYVHNLIRTDTHLHLLLAALTRAEAQLWSTFRFGITLERFNS